MQKFKYLQHTADAKFQAFGKTVEEAFCHAALAMVSLMWDPEKIEAKIELNLCVTGRDEKQLLLNFLQDILFKLDTKMFLLKTVKKICLIEENNQLTLKAVLAGDTFSERYETFGEVKAATYHEMEIAKNHDVYVMVQVVVDM
ncbi:archease [Acidobacteriota bacterium]